MATRTRTSTVILIAVILAFAAILGFFLWTGAAEGDSRQGTQEVTSTATAVALPDTDGEPDY